MTSVTDVKTTRALRRAAIGATRAPSVHNTQPWRLVLRRDGLEIRADRTRQLRVLDPRRRQLMISCGCALFNARVALAAAGFDAVVERFPDALRSDLVARLTIPAAVEDWVQIGDLEPAIELRRTNRRHFEDEPVPPVVIHDLVSAAAAEGAELVQIKGAKQRLTTARLSQQADRIENADPAYRAELRAWTSDDPRRFDGVWSATAPYVGIGADAHDSLPIRKFDTRSMGWLPADPESGGTETLLLLGTLADGPAAWLRAGEALEHVWLELTRLGYAASPLTQVIEVAETHWQLRTELQLAMHPNVLLRVGRAPETVKSRRRRITETISESY
ncbi:MAG: nitroreductase family protein [Actinomycetota bacterium]|nr:nitroreductase family protein [Actinomycetota bacterium]